LKSENAQLQDKVDALESQLANITAELDNIDLLAENIETLLMIPALLTDIQQRLIDLENCNASPSPVVGKRFVPQNEPVYTAREVGKERKVAKAEKVEQENSGSNGWFSSWLRH